jgi:hypothetical protein
MRDDGTKSFVMRDWLGEGVPRISYIGKRRIGSVPRVRLPLANLCVNEGGSRSGPLFRLLLANGGASITLSSDGPPYSPRSSKNFSTSSAAMQPLPAAVIAWR